MDVRRKIVAGFPHLKRELRDVVSAKTPVFLSRPSRFNIYLDGPCNGFCIMCQKGLMNASREGDRNYVNADVAPLLRVMEEMRRLSGKGVLYSFFNGEPLISRDILFPLIRKAKELEAYFSFTTNGYLLNQKTVETLVGLSPFNIGISLESLAPSINESIRPFPNGTKRTVEGIERLHSEIKRQGAATSLNIKVTMTDLNHSSVLDIVRRYGKKKGIMVTPQPFEAFDYLPGEIVERLRIKADSGYETTIQALIQLKKEGCSINASQENLDNMITKVESSETTACEGNTPKQKKRHCTIGNTNLFLDYALGVKLCPEMPLIGNLESGLTIRDIWLGDDARNVRRQIAECDKICTLACLKRVSLLEKVKLFLKRQ